MNALQTNWTAARAGYLDRLNTAMDAAGVFLKRTRALYATANVATTAVTLLNVSGRGFISCIMSAGISTGSSGAFMVSVTTDAGTTYTMRIPLTASLPIPAPPHQFIRFNSTCVITLPAGDAATNGVKMEVYGSLEF